MYTTYRYAEQEFVLGPMCEIAPHKRHPVLKETMTEMLVKLKGNN